MGALGVVDDVFKLRPCGKERSRQVAIARWPVTEPRALRLWQSSLAGKRYDFVLPGTARLSEKLTVLPVQPIQRAGKQTYIRLLRALA